VLVKENKACGNPPVGRIGHQGSFNNKKSRILKAKQMGRFQHPSHSHVISTSKQNKWADFNIQMGRF